MPKYIACLLISLLCGPGGTSTTLAADGVLEISQACAVAGCFSGDTAGFPVTITGAAGKSYLLTSSLTVPNQNTSAIQISIEGISVDLNGFTIKGTTTCNYLPYADCSPVGTGNGISGPAIISVRNGIISGMGGYGLDLGFDSVAEDVRVLTNGLGGIRMGPGGAVRSVTANANNGYGILTDFRNGIYSVIATNNNDGGIKMGQSGLVRDSVMHSNGGPGMECLEGCLATSNQISGNFGGALVAPPTCASTTLAYSGNQINGNFGPISTGCVAQIGQNLCNGSTATCP